QQAYFHYFSSRDPGNADQLKANEPQRLSLYKSVAALVRAYANLAGEMTEAGFTTLEAEEIKKEVAFYENLRSEIKLHSGDAIDLKQYEPAMRHLIDTYLHAEESEKVSAFDDLSLIQLIVQRGADAMKALPEGLRKNKEAAAEAIENNVRKLIIDEQPINPKYYDKMSQLLDALIKQRRDEALSYQEYLRRIVELTKKVTNPESSDFYPKTMNTSGKRALYDNLGKDETLVLRVDAAVHASRQDDWRSNPFKVKRVKNAIRTVLEKVEGQGSPSSSDVSSGISVEGHSTYQTKSVEPVEDRVERVLKLVQNQHEY
ncbi:MAG: restriction endonuclease subunit R, partial [Nitrospiraceae bacterium]